MIRRAAIPVLLAAAIVAGAVAIWTARDSGRRPEAPTPGAAARGGPASGARRATGDGSGVAPGADPAGAAVAGRPDAAPAAADGEPTAPPPAPPSLLPTSISGRAFVGSEAMPLRGRTFRLRLGSGSRSETRAVVTDQEGAFRVADVPPGSYDAVFERESFFPIETDIDVLPGKPVDDLVVIFDRGIRVRGTVRAAGGSAPCAVVLQWRLAGGGPPFVREVEAGADGRYEIGGLAPGTYRVRALPGSLRAAWRDARSREVVIEGSIRQATGIGTEGADNEVDIEVDIEADLGRSLRVRVFETDVETAGIPSSRVADSQGAAPRVAASRVTVRFTLVATGRGVSGVLAPTDAEGVTALCGLPASGRLELAVPPGERGAARVEVDLGSLAMEVEPAEVELWLAPSPAVEGTVRDAGGRPVALARVTASRPGGGTQAAAATDAEGRFRLPLEAGSWTLRIASPRTPTPTPTPTPTQAAAQATAIIAHVEVPEDRAPEALELVLVRECALAGGVVDATGAPVAGARVGVWAPRGGEGGRMVGGVPGKVAGKVVREDAGGDEGGEAGGDAWGDAGRDAGGQARGKTGEGGGSEYGGAFVDEAVTGKDGAFIFAVPRGQVCELTVSHGTRTERWRDARPGGDPVVIVLP